MTKFRLVGCMVALCSAVSAFAQGPACELVTAYGQAQLRGECVSAEQHAAWASRMRALLRDGAWMDCEASLRQQVALAMRTSDTPETRQAAVSVLNDGALRATTALDISSLANDAVSMQLAGCVTPECSRNASEIVVSALGRLRGWDELRTACQAGGESYLAFPFVAALRLYSATSLPAAQDRIDALRRLDQDIRAVRAEAAARERDDGMDIGIAYNATLEQLIVESLALPGADVGAIERDLATRAVIDPREAITSAISSRKDNALATLSTQLGAFDALRTAWGPSQDRLTMMLMLTTIHWQAGRSAGLSDEVASATAAGWYAKLWQDVQTLESQNKVLDEQVVRSVLHGLYVHGKDEAVRQALYARFPEDRAVFGPAGANVILNR